MNPSQTPTHLCFASSTDDVARRGRLGTLAFDLGDLHFDGVQLRRSETGRVYLSFRYAEVRPVDDQARVALEFAVLTALRIRPSDPTEEVAP